MKRKHAFTFVEILLALALSGSLLAGLLWNFTSSQSMRLQGEACMQQCLEWEYCLWRLQSVLEKREDDFSNKGESFFTYQQGVDIQPEFSGLVLGEIAIDAERQLCLYTWPLGGYGGTLYKKEVLLSHVESCSWRSLEGQGGTLFLWATIQREREIPLEMAFETPRSRFLWET